jgi:transposase
MSSASTLRRRRTPLVFAVDEKPQIQALQRTAPVLPMIPGAPERRGFDYVRHGTVDLFAALDTATGKVIGKLSARHRAIDFRDFPDEIDRRTDPGLEIHVICDNLSAHKAPAVQRWLLAHPRAQLHFTPTYPSWISQVERWFAELQRRCLDRGVFCSLDELTTALEDWIEIWNAPPGPSSGPRPPTRSSTASAATAHASSDRDSRRSRGGRAARRAGIPHYSDRGRRAAEGGSLLRAGPWVSFHSRRENLVASSTASSRLERGDVASYQVPCRASACPCHARPRQGSACSSNC